MLIPFDELQQLDKATLELLIKEHLYSQIEDGSLATFTAENIQGAIARTLDLLKKGELVVEYSEENETIAIKNKDYLPK
ncbi:YheU family protein [Paraferrimonas sp. SM1919]|uniref:YheU family protein n=1 Tax=Paraferrimonas sp. SM1919 TaxID=2662263 RepID=UPI0013D37807|nr:YheU family protein [Paraferrimonas sp. SM1919]